MRNEGENLSCSQRKKLKVIKVISATIDYVILTGSILLLVIGMYAIYDNHKVYKLADSEEYAKYKPSEEDHLSYDKLRKMNSDVIGWINVYGTKIDYPILQTTDNDRYLDETVDGRYSTAGSIFLDYRNSKDFSDFNSIIYGHHMDQRLMFGDVDKFIDKKFFNEHAYAVLHRNDKKSLGIEFFSIIKTEGTDSKIYTAALPDDSSRKALVNYLYDKALQSRPMNIDQNDRIVLLNTCTFTITNGRYILAGKLLDEVPNNPFPDSNEINRKSAWIKKVPKIPLLVWLILLLMILVLIYCLYEIRRRNQKKRV